MGLPLKLQSLHDAITKALDRVMIPDAGLLHFLSSTFSVTSASELEQLKSPGCENDCDLFLDLAVSPDMDIMERLEPLIWSEPLTDDYQHILAESVSKKISHLSFLMPKAAKPVIFDLPYEKISGYIEKLHLGYGITPTLLDTMDNVVSIPVKVAVCQRLRRFMVPMEHKKTEDFLVCFTRESSCLGDAFLDCLDMALPVLTLTSPGTTVKDALVARLATLNKTLIHIVEAQDMMKKNSMEALMLQGFRIPPASRESIENEIILLRRVLACVFNWIRREHGPVIHRHLGDHDTVESVEQIIQLLS